MEYDFIVIFFGYEDTAEDRVAKLDDAGRLGYRLVQVAGEYAYLQREKVSA